MDNVGNGNTLVTDFEADGESKNEDKYALLSL